MRFYSGWGGRSHDAESKPLPRLSSVLKVGLSFLAYSTDILRRLVHQNDILMQRQTVFHDLSRSHHELITARWVRRG